MKWTWFVLWLLLAVASAIGVVYFLTQEYSKPAALACGGMCVLGVIGVVVQSRRGNKYWANKQNN